MIRRSTVIRERLSKYQEALDAARKAAAQDISPNHVNSDNVWNYYQSLLLLEQVVILNEMLARLEDMSGNK